MHLVDSSVWVALFLENDSQHEKAVSALDTITPPVYITRGVVAEVCTVLTYKHSKGFGNNFAEFIQGNADIIVLPDELAEQLRFFRGIDVDISFQDSSIIYLAKSYNLEILSFDTDLMKVAESI